VYAIAGTVTWARNIASLIERSIANRRMSNGSIGAVTLKG
jgi:hypothetical protein